MFKKNLVNEWDTKLGQGRGVERFMKHYFLTAKDIGDLTRVLCAVLEERHKKRRTPVWFNGFRVGKREVRVSR